MRPPEASYWLFLAAPARESRGWLTAGTLLLAVLAFTAVALVLRRGMPCNLDGWFYWQGSVSILKGVGYEDFSGRSITDWPPGYSVYLAFIQHFLGVSVRSLALSTAFATALAVASWSLLLCWFARERDRSAGEVLCALAFLSVLLALNARQVRAENLANAVLPLLLLFTLRARSSTAPRRFLLESGLAASALLVFLLLRNAALAFWPAVLAVLIQHRRFSWSTRAVACVLVTAPVLLFWLVVRPWLGQGGSHPVGLGAGKHGFIEFVVLFVSGIDRNGGVKFVGLPLTILLAASLLRGDSTRADAGESGRLGRTALLFTVVAVCALLAIFNLTWIGNEPDKRFTLFVTLVVGGLGLLHLPSLLRWRWLALALIVLFAQPTLRLAKHTILGRGPDEPGFHALSGRRAFVPSRATIAPDHVGRAPEPSGDLVLVSPPYPESIAYPAD